MICLPKDPTCMDFRMSSFWRSCKDFQASWHSLLFCLFSFLSSSITLLVSRSSIFWRVNSLFSFWISSSPSLSPLSYNNIIEYTSRHSKFMPKDYVCVCVSVYYCLKKKHTSDGSSSIPSDTSISSTNSFSPELKAKSCQ